jgi:hypothetical protein
MSLSSPINAHLQASSAAHRNAGCGILIPVSPTTVQSLAALCPAIKKEWVELLQFEPTITPLGRPDTLVYLMDATLAQLFSGLETKSTKHWLRDCAPVVGSMHGYCACGLNPLLKYFTTGELALRAAAGAPLGTDVEEVLLLFRALAQREIQTLCSVCQHKGAPGCTEPVQKPHTFHYEPPHHSAGQ